MAFPSIAATNTTNGTVASATPVINLPTGIVSGNLLLAFIRVVNDAGGSITWPAGWNELFETVADASNDRMSLAWRLADGTEGSTVTVTNGGGVSGLFAALSWRIT